MRDLNLLCSATGTLGLSGDFFESDALINRRSHVKPKVGILFGYYANDSLQGRLVQDIQTLGLIQPNT